MAGLLYAGFGYGRTSDLPGIWTSATAVEILSPPAGRFGGGCAAFSAADGSTLSKTVAFAANVAVVGFAIKPTSVLGARVTLAQFVTSAPSVIQLQATTQGALVVVQDDVDCCAGGHIALDDWSYVELRIQLAGTPKITVRIGTLTVATGALITTTGTITEFFLGAGIGETGDFRLTDLYLLDGTVVNPISIGSRVIDNASFLGNVRVEALYATADGYNTATGVDPGYVPWTPASGAVHYTQINENPPDGGVTNESADASQIGTYAAGLMDKYDTFPFQHPSQSVPGFGFMPGGVNYQPLFAVQLVYALLVDAAHDVDATVRVVDDLPSSDHVEIGDTLTPTQAAYTYFSQIFDRDPSL